MSPGTPRRCSTIRRPFSAARYGRKSRDRSLRGGGVEYTVRGSAPELTDLRMRRGLGRSRTSSPWRPQTAQLRSDGGTSVPKVQRARTGALVRRALALCHLGVLALTGCCACGAIISKIEVNLPTGQVVPSSPILVKEFQTAPGVTDEDSAIRKAIPRLLVVGLSAQGYQATYHSPVRETPDTLVIDGVITHFDRGSDVVRFFRVFFVPALALSGQADLLAARAKATVTIYKAPSPDCPLAHFQIEAFDGAVGAAHEECLERDLCEGIRNYLNKRLRPDLPAPTAVSCPSYVEH